LGCRKVNTGFYVYRLFCAIEYDCINNAYINVNAIGHDWERNN